MHAHKANSEGLFYMLDFSVRLPPGESSVVQVDQTLTWDPDDVQMVAPAPIPKTRRTTIDIPANDAGTTWDAVNDDDARQHLPTFRPQLESDREQQDDSDEQTPSDDAITESMRASQRVGHGLAPETVNTDVLPALALNTRTFQTDVGDVDWEAVDNLRTVNVRFVENLLDGTIGDFEEFREFYADTLREEQIFDPELPNVLKVDSSRSVVDTDARTATTPAMPIQWRLSEAGSHDNTYHALLGRREPRKVIEQALAAQMDATVGDLDLETIANTATMMYMLPLRLMMDPTDITGAVEGSTPMGNVQYPDSYNGTMGIPLYASNTVDEGFYTISATARNADGRTDTVEKSIAVDKDVLPIVDHPEPLPADRAVPFKGYVTGPRADEVDEWEWRIEPADGYENAGTVDTAFGFDADTGRSDVALEPSGPVPHTLTVTVGFGDGDTVERQFDLYPKAEGAVPFVWFEDRPVEVGKPATIHADLLQPAGGESVSLTGREWTIEGPDTKSAVMSLVDGESGGTHETTFYQHPARIAVDYEFADRPALRVTETVHPDSLADEDVLAVAAEATDGSDFVRAESEAQLRAWFQGMEDRDGVLPRFVEESVSADAEPEKLFALRVRGTGDVDVDRWFGRLRERAYTFPEPGVYEVTAYVFDEPAPGSWNGISTTYGALFERTVTVTVTNDEPIGLAIDVEPEVPTGVPVHATATVWDHVDEPAHYWWRVEPDSDGEQRVVDGPEMDTLEHAFTDSEGATITLEVDATGAGEPTHVTSTSIRTAADAVAIAADGHEVATHTEMAFEARLGPELRERYDGPQELSFEWEVTPTDAMNDETVLDHGEDELTTTHAFDAVGVYDVGLAVSYSADGDDVTKRASYTVHASHAPAELEVGIDPPENCQSTDTSSTSLALNAFELAVDGVAVEQVSASRVNFSSIQDRSLKEVYSYLNGDHDPRATEGRFLITTESSSGFVVETDDTTELEELFTSHKCERPRFVVRFAEVPDSVELSFEATVDAKQAPAQAYVRSRELGDQTARTDLPDPGFGGQETEEYDDVTFFSG